MNITNFIKTYPMTSTNFVHCKVEAYRRTGFAVPRFAIRTWEAALIDPLGIAERGHLEYRMIVWRRRLVGPILGVMAPDLPRISHTRRP